MFLSCFNHACVGTQKSVLVAAARAVGQTVGVLELGRQQTVQIVRLL
jgi:hypothetical protein